MPICNYRSAFRGWRNYTLDPLALWLERLQVPRFAGAALAMLALVYALLFGTYSSRRHLKAIRDQLPNAVRTLLDVLAKLVEGHLETAVGRKDLSIVSGCYRI